MVAGSVAGETGASLAAMRRLGKGKRGPHDMLRESHTLPMIRRPAQFLFVRRSNIGNFGAFVVTSPD
jgi:hypothetical protein